jgi:N6-adenosine-specific RNA methylase IME4
MPSPTRESCVLYQNRDGTIVLLDIPRSIETAQGFPEERSILSSSPPSKPWINLPEPKSAKALANLTPPTVQELILQRHLELSLSEIHGANVFEWNLPRFHVPDLTSKQSHTKAVCSSQNEAALDIDVDPAKSPHIPTNATFIQGLIVDTIETFTSIAPQFSLIVMDPPWPNRSARRKDSYNTLYGIHETSLLLSSIPLNDHVSDDGLVGVWITNKPLFRDLLLDPGGIFDLWDLELVEEWVWLKITINGEPIFPLKSVWRKPYEILLVGRKKRSQLEKIDVKRRVIMAVPDLHSRKPNLKELFNKMLPGKYEALEIFARNLTSGWWAWGDEVLKFQYEEHWVDRNAENLQKC